ncbi:hypothetical protein N7532_004037 [Penicillium argentinense]|uniref:Uncharacterized protein n=1 Tax=Penicillium argentinense TaxID=1131581 RepID=A0A9W9FNL5_9EURO|nr:uncharacterized protein N7532_004037 [Penicillium argentinense]KAJ5103508.1 hypothetical protein N7532_004037 [Penicillium argentinense]
MAWGRAGFGLYSLSLLPLTWAIAFPGSQPTATAHAVLQPDFPVPTPGINLKRKGFERRDSDEDAFVSSFLAGEGSLLSYPSAITTTTSWQPQSVCGYINGAWSDYSSIRCQNNRQCVFHTPDSKYPGMVGCCDGSKPEDCAWGTVCYNSRQVSATPSLLNYPTNIFAIYCTESDQPSCRTWTYPQLDITDFGCWSTTTTQTLWLIATTAASATGDAYGGYSTTTSSYNYYAYYPTVAAISPQVVDDSWIEVYISGPAATSDKADKITSAVASGSSAGSDGASSTDSSSNDKSNPNTGPSKSTNVGAIAGGVVGGVVGAVGIGAAIVMFCLLKKKRKQAEQGAYQAGSGDGGTMPQPPPPGNMDVAPRPMLEVEGAVLRKYAEVDGYPSASKFPPEVVGSEVTDKPLEMDSRGLLRSCLGMGMGGIRGCSCAPVWFGISCY